MPQHELSIRNFAAKFGGLAQYQPPDAFYNKASPSTERHDKTAKVLEGKRVTIHCDRFEKLSLVFAMCLCNFSFRF